MSGWLVLLLGLVCVGVFQARRGRRGPEAPVVAPLSIVSAESVKRDPGYRYRGSRGLM